MNTEQEKTMLERFVRETSVASLDIQIKRNAAGLLTGMGPDRRTGLVEAGNGLTASTLAAINLEGPPGSPRVSCGRIFVQATKENGAAPDDETNQRNGHQEGCGCPGKCAHCTCEEKRSGKNNRT